MPSPPRSLPGVAHFPPIARLMQRLNVTAREVDERYTVEDCLDEADYAAYINDVDREPEQPPKPARR